MPTAGTDLNSGCALSHAAASRMVDGLIKAGLVDRREGKADRRQKSVTIVPAGQEQFRPFRALTAQIYADPWRC